MSNYPSSSTSGSKELYDLVWFPQPDWWVELASIALPERWDEGSVERYVILKSYLRYYTRRIVEENLWIESDTPSGVRMSAFDTGLLSKNFEPIYAIFEANRDLGRQPWVHREWAVPSSSRLRDFEIGNLHRAVFFTDPAEVIYDPRLKVVPNLEHVINENVVRFPELLQTNDYLRQATLANAITVAAAKARSNWRLAAPQFYWPPNGDSGRIQLLLPLALIDPNVVDLALVVDRHPSISEHPSPEGAVYRAHTVLPLDWAYRNARLITKPEAYWLDINYQTLRL